MNRIKTFLAFTAIIVAMGIVGHMDADEAERQQEQYCEMVKLYKETNGEKGWPAYNDDVECK